MGGSSLKTKSALFLEIMQRIEVIPHRRFGTDTLTWNVGKELPLYAVQYPREVRIASSSWRKHEISCNVNDFNIPEFAWRELAKPQQTSVRVVGNPAEKATYLQNANQPCVSLGQLYRQSCCTIMCGTLVHILLTANATGYYNYYKLGVGKNSDRIL